MKCILVIWLLYSYIASINATHITKTNVLVLVADDFGLELNSYGNNVIKTPHIDELASQGTVYKNAFTSVSSCSPSRSAILTGLPQHQNGMYGLHNGYHHFNSFDEVQSLPLILKNHGIRTGIIGKKHVAPEAVYPFDYAETEENNSILQVGRNITKMKELARKFFVGQPKDKPFMLYVGFHDPHRCGHTHIQYGAFCEQFGNGQEGMGLIPDWKPTYYDPKDIVVSDVVQDTKLSREDISAQYTTISRLDQGIGLILSELKMAGFADNTLIIFTSDNGPPFPNGRTNLYQYGVHEPFIISSPDQRYVRNSTSEQFVSLLDITPTILEWFNIPYPTYTLLGRSVKLTGKSLLHPSKTSDQIVFGSHSLHEVTMYYPMRSVRKNNFTYIENLNNLMPFPIDQDFYLSPSFDDLLNRTYYKQDLHWFKTLHEYYYRPQYELYNLTSDPIQKNNLAMSKNHESLVQELKGLLKDWEKTTFDPWRCAPDGVLQDKGQFKDRPLCMPLLNGFK